MDDKFINSYLWMDGEFKKWNEAQVHGMCLTLHYGLGVFEGVRCYMTPKGPAIFRLDDHTKRLFNSAHIMKIKMPYTQKEINDAQISTIKINQLNSAYIRPLVYYGEESIGLHSPKLKAHVLVAALLWGSFFGLEDKEKGITLLSSSYSRSAPNSVMIKSKTCGNYVNSLLALGDAKGAGFDDSLLLDSKGCVSEASAANVFIVKDGVIYTPNSFSILEGITRDTVITLSKDLGYNVLEKDLTKDNIYTADEMFLTGTAAEITCVSNVDNRKIGNGKRGPITKKINDLYEATVTGKNTSYSDWLTYID